jgi:hypothetical protein
MSGIGDVRIRCEEANTAFPSLVTPGGGLNSRVRNWATAVFIVTEAFQQESGVRGRRCGRQSSGGGFRDDDAAQRPRLPVR